MDRFKLKILAQMCSSEHKREFINKNCDELKEKKNLNDNNAVSM